MSMTKDNEKNDASSGRSMASSLWLLLTIALLPVLFALVVPMLPELVRRIERVKFGSFEASMVNDRAAAGATSAVFAERSSQEFDFDLDAWAKYNDRLERNKFIEKFFNKLATAEDSFAVVHQALVRPLASLLICQREAGVGYPEYQTLVDRMIFILSERSVFDGLVENARSATRPVGQTPRYASAEGILAQAAAATGRLQVLLQLEGRLTHQDDCGAQELQDGLLRVHIADGEHPATAFRNGHLSAFVATLIIIRGASTDAALARAARDLYQVAEESGDAAKRLSPIEMFNVRWTLARAMLRARWDAKTVYRQLDEARISVYCMSKAMRLKTEKDEDKPEVKRCGSLSAAPGSVKSTESDRYADELWDSFRPLVLIDMLMLVNQYQLESLDVPEEAVAHAVKIKESLEKISEDWLGPSDSNSDESRRRDRILANATSNVQLFGILNAQREGRLDPTVCRRAERRMRLVTDFWENQEEEARRFGQIGASAAPFLLAQKFSRYVIAACSDV